MPTLRIRHEDGREFNVAEAAYTDLYEPFGFKPQAVIFGGTEHAYTPENLEAAKVYEKSGYGPNDTPTTLETSARQALDAGQEERAADLTQRANALHKATNTEGLITYPPVSDLSLGDIKVVTPEQGGNTDGETDTGAAAAKASAAAVTAKEAAPKGKGK